MNHHGGCNDNMSKSQYGIERLERGKIGNGCGNILKFYHQYIHSSYYSNVEKSYCAEATLLNSLQKLCKNGLVIVIIPYIIGVGKSWNLVCLRLPNELTVGSHLKWGPCRAFCSSAAFIRLGYFATPLGKAMSIMALNLWPPCWNVTYTAQHGHGLSGLSFVWMPRLHKLYWIVLNACF